VLNAKTNLDLVIRVQC